MSKHNLLVALGAVALGSVAAAHVRLQHPLNGNKLRWIPPSAIPIVIQATGSDDLTDASHVTALRNAIDAWNACTGTSATLVENTSVVQQARTDYTATDLHTILFDETNASGYFPGLTGIVALTPVSFAANGVIVDGDVLFNGVEFEFTTSGALSRFDVQDVATHELGHFLGLDHSGWAGASMYPYVDPQSILHRSVSLDDERGLRDAYPSGTYASIGGTVRRASDNTVVAGASVSARDSLGRSAGNALCDDNGVFTLKGLAADMYTVFASPLDSPVSEMNLGAGHAVDTDFESTSFGTHAVTAGQALSLGDVLVGDDVAFGLGTNTDDFPLRVVAGTTAPRLLHGTGFDALSTLAASDADPGFVVTPTLWLGGQVNFTVQVPANSPPGHVDLIATRSTGERSILPAALEITPADPAVNTVAPDLGTKNGGTAITIAGTGFTAGSRVVIGTRIYADGAPNGCTVVDPNTITLTTLATSVGTYDVVVIGSTGVEGRKVGAYRFRPLPIIQARFPSTGSSAGGTSLVITGSDFDPALVVRIDGVQQTQVTVDSATRVVVLTDGGVPGPQVLEVENPGGDVASSAYTYVAAQDPSIASVTPAVGKTSGGSTITIAGTNFQAPLDVYFDADPDTGLGGTAAASVTIVDPSTLEVVTPSHASGAVSVLVQAANGQAAIAAAAYTFQKSGGGGGGCSVAPHYEPRGPREVLAGLAWIVLAAMAIYAQSRLQRRTS